MNGNWELTPQKFLNTHELAALLNKAEELWVLGLAKKSKTKIREAVILKVAMGTGLRRAELCDLRVADLSIGPGASFLTVRNGKGGKQRVVHFGRDLKTFLKQYLKWKADHGELTPDSYLLRTKKSEKYSVSALWRRWKHYCPKKLHSARHSFGTYLYQSTKDIRLCQKMLGHSSLSTTAIYSDCPPEVIAAGMENFERLTKALRKCTPVPAEQLA